MSKQVGRDLQDVAIGIYGAKQYSDFLAGGNAGAALMGKYVADSNLAIAEAINALASATQALANRQIIVNVPTQTMVKPSNPKKQKSNGDNTDE